MSKDMENSNNQDNEGWNDQNKKRIVREESGTEYNSEGPNMSKQYFIPPPQQTHITIPKQHEFNDGNYGQQQQQSINMNKNCVPEDAEVSDAIIFLKKIKEEYANEMVTYDNFLETMRDFKFGKIDADEVCKAVRLLFKEKPHLIDAFNEYLPNHLKFSNESRTNEGTGTRPFERIIHHQPMQFRRNLFNPNQKMMHGPPPHPMMHKIGHPPPHIHQPHLPGGMHPGMVPNYGPQSNIQHYGIQTPMRVPNPNVQKPHFNFQNFPPLQQQADDYEKLKRTQAKDYIQKVKNRYINQPNTYKAFVELLQNYKGNADFERVYASIKCLFWEHPDLIMEFEKDFIDRGALKKDFESTIYKKIADTLLEKDVLNDFFRCLNYFNQSLISQKDLLFMVEPLLKNAELIDSFRKYIKYEDTPVQKQTKALEKCKKIGSYKILENKITNENQEPIAREVLNTTCVSCPTFESEDANFVFIKRNHYEDSLFKVEEERYDASLLIERIDYLIMSLEMLYSNLQESDLSIRDLGMSPGIVKEILRSIYDDSAHEILEGILTNAKVAIPIVIKRLYSVNKQWREKLRAKNKIWKDSIVRVYYKALDTYGSIFRSNDKSLMNPKNLGAEYDSGLMVDISDVPILDDTIKLFYAYIKTNQADNKKAHIPGLFDGVDLMFNILRSQNAVFKSNFDVFCAFRLLILVYQRLKEIKDMKLPVLESSKMAVDLNLSEEYKYENRYEEVIKFTTEYLEKNIDSAAFEEKMRMFTDCKGFKLFGIRKIFSKIEKLMICIVDDPESIASLEKREIDFNIRDGALFKFKDGKLEVTPADKDYSDTDTSKIFLNKNLKEDTYCGVMLNDMKIGVREDGDTRPLENSELFYISVDSTILKKD